MNKLKRGLFIVFEGLDRSGKTTQVKKLQDYFATASLPEENKKVKLMRFPGIFYLLFVNIRQINRIREDNRCLS